MSSLLELAQVINDKYGIDTLLPLSRRHKVVRIPTGIVDLDIKLGGGFPTGRLISVWGPESSGKTTLALLNIKEAQKLCRHDAMPLGDPEDEDCSSLPLEPEYTDPKGKPCTAEEATEYVDQVDPNTMEPIKIPQLKKGYTESDYQEPMRCLFVNQEGTLDVKWAKQLGVDIDNLYVLDSPNAEHTIDIVNAALDEHAVDLVVVDSIAAMTPLKESESSAEDWQQGLQARLVNKALRMWVASILKHKSMKVRPTVVMINQVRTKIGLPSYINPDTKPGGKGQDFAIAIDIKLSKGGVDKKTDIATEDEGGHLYIARTNFSIPKNKTYPAKSYGQYLLAVAPHADIQPGEIVQFKQIMGIAENYGILRKDKSKWKLGDLEFPTKKAITAWSQKEPKEYTSFVRALMKFVIEKRSGVSD